MRRLLIVSALVLAGCVGRKSPPAPQPGPSPMTVVAPPSSSEPAAVSAAALVDHEGDSPETAVIVPKDAPNEGIDFENNWMYDHYGRFRRRGWGIAHAGEGSAVRQYKVITIELADHSERKVFFDITENWKSWRPPGQ